MERFDVKEINRIINKYNIHIDDNNSKRYLDLDTDIINYFVLNGREDFISAIEKEYNIEISASRRDELWSFRDISKYLERFGI